MLLTYACFLAALAGLATGDEDAPTMETRHADDGEFPFQVSVKDLRHNVSICSGVVITQRTVLLTATCLEGRDHVKVSGGSSQRSRQNWTATSVEVIRHEAWNQSGSSDVALLRLAEPFPLDHYIEKAKLPLEGTPLANRTSFTGWNIVDVHDFLLAVENYTTWRSDCRRRFDLEADVTTAEFCGSRPHGTASRGGVISKRGIVYGLQTPSLLADGQMNRFVEVAANALWIRKQLDSESFEVDWHEQDGGGCDRVACHVALLSALVAVVVALAWRN